MTVLTAELLPRLRAQGMDAETTRLLTETNPFHAFAR